MVDISISFCLPACCQIVDIICLFRELSVFFSDCVLRTHELIRDDPDHASFFLLDPVRA